MKNSQWIAMGLTVAIVSWISIGMALKANDKDSDESLKLEQLTRGLITVEVSEQTALPITSFISVQGNVVPKREVIIQSEISGKIEKVIMGKGYQVVEGALLGTIDVEDRMTRLEMASAKTEVERQKYKSLKNLGDQGYTAKNRVDEAYVTFKAAEADEEAIILEIEQTEIRAPFKGVISDQMVEKGDFVNVGEDLFSIVDNNPLVVEVHVGQHDINTIRYGSAANVELATGATKEGIVSFISPKAEPGTRTFRVEIEINNPENLRSGISAAVKIPKEELMAHFVSSALLTLDDKGNSGIKIVDDLGLVAFYEVDIIGGDKDGIHVTGLPHKSRIIQNGQGFVNVGDAVNYSKVENKYLSKN